LLQEEEKTMLISYRVKKEVDRGVYSYKATPSIVWTYFYSIPVTFGPVYGGIVESNALYSSVGAGARKKIATHCTAFHRLCSI
jgi:hypothetical protein